MFGAIVVLWLGSPAGLGAHDADIATFCAARGLSARAPAQTPERPHDPSLADQIEALLEEARAAPTAAGAASAFERAEHLLLAHPELPQAAWLLAERYASEAHALGSRDDQIGNVAPDLLERARRLEGPRARAVGSAPLPAPVSLEPAPLDAPRLLRGVRPRDGVFVDGEPSAGRELTPGRHHVLLVRGSRRVWTGWVDASPPSRPGGDATESVALPDPTAACSDLDLADVSDGPGAPRVAPAVACPRWLAARPRALGGTEIAECAGSVCGRWRPAGMGAPSADAREAVAAEGEPWPSWVTWGLVGAGAAVATGLLLWQTGTFDRSEPSTEFVFTGPSAAAYRF